jgi:hypothetical protein
MNQLTKKTDYTEQIENLISEYPKMSDFSQAIDWAMSHENANFSWAANVSGNYYTWHTREMIGLPECVIMFQYTAPEREVVLIAITEVFENENVFLDLRV